MSRLASLPARLPALLARRPAGSASKALRPAELSDEPLPPLDQTIAPWPGRRINLDGSEIYVRDTPATGDQPEPALYVHGLGGASTNWTDLAAQLAPRLAGQAIDLPGFGRSGPAPDGDYSLAAHARVVIRYLQSRRPDRGPVHLFGNSMGGAIAILVASERPELVRTLTLVSPAVPDLRPRRGGPDPRMLVAIVPGVGTAAMRRMQRLPVEARVRSVIELCFADPSLVSPERLDEAVREASGRDGLRWADTAMASSLRSIVANYLRTGAQGLWARMAAIQAPTLVVWGDRDRLVSVRVAPRVAATIPDARLLVLPGVGHVAQMEDPVRTARAVLALLSDARDGADRVGVQATSVAPLDADADADARLADTTPGSRLADRG